MTTVEDVLKDLKIPFRQDGWGPRTPPRDVPYYATIEYETQDLGADEIVMMRRVVPTLLFYDAGTPACVEMRMRLHNALSAANIKHSMSRPDYWSSEKLFLTYFDIESHIVKRGFNEEGY